MRAIWKGAVSFGLVSIPVKLYTATEEKDVSFHQVHREDGGRIRYKRVCQIDGEEVQYSDIAKGYELPSGETVILTDDDLADLPLATSRVVDVLAFVPLDQVDPIYFAKTYFLEPDKTATKPYILLRDSLEKADSVALVKVAIRTRESLGTQRVSDRVLMLETMIMPDKVRTPDKALHDKDIKIRSQELAMAESLIESMSGDFDPEQYTDDYRQALQEVIEAKVEGREVVEQPVEEEETGSVVDLMAALRASVDAAKKSRGESSSSSSSSKSTAKKAPAKKAPAKKTAAKSTAKKAPAKKTTAKKTAARKSA